ncbi:MAG: hypothetical protein A3B86_01575 [Candidatus Yanofskybacteria bacterium RIFCSPHIGHO2_02_FULL_38_22b]|uniref:Uncharacterized protein n=1 Tax=Candidatus Yanofskybacteria bacterium RIFCSPHIGHO2_02_FULL_38_22b TaxID=1802673 RepID=A0A1F8F491_9BACT|nr:MAG: hypothetical protein A3B86_01575 [Candidatus Yanofskybacteria bacterium RIFCSPHIGHO2_02_FULL_38_22b]OGN19820.1 MAG: hypothetical protein A2910_02055 [Candidatus Yanofskybacteria bacterium RIFCSPLOWO2_01_FULL_39_28]
MLVIKCDICKKEIKKEAVFASVGSSFLSNHQAFCLNCGKLIVNFLRKINNKKNGKQKRK